MKTFRYTTGEEIRKGDRVIYFGDEGTIEFVVSQPVGDPAVDWYIQQFPGGGAMITASDFGSVFLGVDDIDDRLKLRSRGGS